MFGSAIAGNCGPWKIERQIQRRRSALELVLPIIKLAGERSCFDLITLLQRIIAVLNRQCGQIGRVLCAQPSITLSELAQQHAQRPAITDDVMNCQKEQRFILRELQVLDAQQRISRQVKRRFSLARQEPVDFSLPISVCQRLEINDIEQQRDRRLDDSTWPTVSRNKVSAQRLVPLNNQFKRFAQLLDIAIAFHAVRATNVVSRAFGFQLIKEPESLLSRR